jgi:hypothetical protein
VDSEQTTAIFGMLADIREQIGALGKGVDVLDERTKEILAEGKRTNGRVSALERFRWLVVGAAMAAAAVSTWAWDVWKTLNGKH